jgi:nicotinamide-nucleotide amidase
MEKREDKDIRGREIASVRREKLFRTIGLQRERIERALSDIRRWGKAISIKTEENIFGVDVKVVVESEKERFVTSLMDSAESEIRRRLKDAVYGTDDESLERVVGYLCCLRNVKLAVAESCTGGLVGHLITNVAGASEYFAGGVVAYSNSAKTKILGVEEGVIRRCGAVSELCAKEMAGGVKELFSAQIGLSVTGIAGPSGGSPDKPVGLVYIGVADERSVFAKRFLFSGNRCEIKEKSAYYALNEVRRRFL